MLTGALPMFIIHKSYNHSATIPEVFSVARRYVRGQAGLGVAVRLPSISSEAAATFMEGTQAALRIADPEIHTIPNAEAPATKQPAKAIKNHSWMKEIPAKPNGPWIDQVIDAQVRADANVFLSASGWVSEINAVKNLETQMAWVRATRTSLGESKPMFVNLTLPAVWLSNSELRSSLKQEMNESNERLWWLRFYWPKLPVRYGQLLDGDVLDGYRDVAGNAAVEDKVVVFPNSGLTGWLATAWGGHGFSTGTSWTEQQYSEPVIAMTPKDTPRPPPLERYFDRTVLHSLPRDVQLAIRGEHGHLSCRCRFCRRLNASPTHQQPVADQHYLLECARLTAELRSTTVLGKVREAERFVASLATPLTGKARPQHLPLWESRLR
jgi:hypothetical protein